VGAHERQLQHRTLRSWALGWTPGMDSKGARGHGPLDVETRVGGRNNGNVPEQGIMRAILRGPTWARTF